MKFAIEWAVLALAAMAVSSPVLAERADRDKPVNIEADSARMDDVQKLAIYEGRVMLTQGTLKMNAERIELHQDEKGFYSGVATGDPVQFRQKQEGREEWIEGWAKRIEYDARGDSVRLVGSARLKKGEEELRGEVIVYDARSGQYQARGGEAGKPGGRVKAVILPKTRQGGDRPGTAGKP